MKILLAFSVILQMFACSNSKSAEIIGYVKNLPAKKVYLVDPFTENGFIDSSTYTNGAFRFSIKITPTFEPKLCAIGYHDGKQMRLLIYSLGQENQLAKKQAASAFMLEEGETLIEGEFKPEEKFNMVNITGGKQTQVYHKFQLSDFAYINGEPDRSAAIKKYMTTIKEYPHAYILLRWLYNNKSQYKKEELRLLLALFDTDVKKGHLYAKFIQSLELRPDEGESYPNIALTDTTEKKGLLLDTTAKMNMLVFWASWCGPCIAEIPTLKDVYQRFRSKGLHMISISIDTKKEEWKKELNIQKMPWNQYHVEQEQLDEIKSRFNFSAIPMVIFIDEKGKEIKRFDGYNKDNQAVYATFLESVM